MKHLKNTFRTLIVVMGVSAGLPGPVALAAPPVPASVITQQGCECFEVNVVGQGPAVLMIPGLASSGEVWHDTVDALKAEYQLHILTLAGFAGVKPLSAETLQHGYLHTQLDAILRYIDVQQLDKPAIVGHSLGGYLALALAIRAPGQISAVINVDSLPALGDLFVQEAAPADFDPQVIAESMTSNTQWQQRIVTDMWRSDGMTSGLVMGELMRADLRPELSALEVPVLTLGALQNGAPYATPAQVQANYESQFENAPTQFHSFAFAHDARHFIMAEAPQWMHQHIQQFLRLNSARSQ